MRQIIIFAAILAFLFSSTVYSSSFRCGDHGKNYASEGQHKYEILKDCGPPVSKEIVGVDDNDSKYRIVEEWLYIIEKYGVKQMYLIKFDGNGVAVEIDWLGEQK